MPRKADPGVVTELRRYLARGPADAAAAAQHLGISQPTFSRLVARARQDVLLVGRARAARYAAYREIEGVGRSVPIFAVDDAGGARQLGTLHATLPRGFFFEAVDHASSAFFDDLPYFLHDMRPSGFLGRLIPRRHPELGAPSDIQLWSADHCLRYLARYGWNLPGNFIVGDEAFRLHLTNATSPAALVDADAREARYLALADDALAAGAPGSSAGGEQPKFLATRAPGVDVLVKFSPPVADPVSQRLADLLVCEHLAHETLTAHQHPAARSQLLTAQGRVLLEIERFDRLPGGGRRGLISLFALDAEFVGRLHRWTDSTRALVSLGKLSEAIDTAVRWRELFGRLIANSDMHAANLSFFTDSLRVTALAPAYDMLPMAYAPTQGHLHHPRFDLPLPEPRDADVWSSVRRAAIDFWGRVAQHELVSANFRRTATENRALLEKSSGIDRMLPKPRG